MSNPSAAPLREPDATGGLEFTQGAWRELLNDREALQLPHLQVQPLSAFLKAAEQQALHPDQKDAIRKEAAFLLEHLYPHLPSKQERYLSAPLAMLEAAQFFKDEREFHARVTDAMMSVVDAHTLYGLPAPYTDAVAFLPFQLKFYWDLKQQPHFVVTSLIDSKAPPKLFGPGAEIVTWNGVRAAEAIPNSRGSLASGNYYVRVRRGATLAARLPLRFCEPPLEDRVTLGFVARSGGKARKIELMWGVATGLDGHTGLPGTAYSVSSVNRTVESMNRTLARQVTGAAPVPPPDDQISELPETFEFQYAGGPARPGVVDPARLRAASKPDGKFGYLRIRQFAYGKAIRDGAVAEFQRILTLMNDKAPDGLIVDIRGNPGGDIIFAESLLPMLGAEPFTPINFHLANTETVRAYLRGLDQLAKDPAASGTVRHVAHNLKPWIDDLEKFDPKDTLSPGHPLTTEDDLGSGRVYQGKCALLIDGESYSSADIFAAGFQDHSLGPVIGADATTGGGGANVWEHQDLIDHLTAIPEMPNPTALPNGATLSLAIRRATRVGRHAPLPIEDFGVKADIFFAAGCAEELLEGSQSIVQFACDYLTKPKDSSIVIEGVRRRGHTGEVKIKTEHVEFVQIFINGTICKAARVKDTPAHTLRFAIPEGTPEQAEILLRGGYYYGESGLNNFVFDAEAAAILAS